MISASRLAAGFARLDEWPFQFRYGNVNGEMTMKTIFLTAAMTVALSVGASAAMDFDKVGPRLTTFAIQVGRVDALASACEIRDDEWVDALETEFAMEVIDRAGKGLSQDELSMATHFADQQLEKAKAVTLADFAQGDTAKICGALKRDTNLKRADDMVKKGQQPRDWSGLGGIK